MLLRVDAAPADAKFVCNYNTVQNSKDTLIVKNATSATVLVTATTGHLIL
jgi:hypothetical protein